MDYILNKIKIIDKKLFIINNTINKEDYSSFIENSSPLASYDYLLGNIELGLFSKNMLTILDKNSLNLIEQEVDNKLRELKLI